MTDNASIVQWQFIRDRVHDTWSWRSMRMDGTTDRMSASFTEFGKTVSDAVRNGFNPSGQHWVIADREWATHFEPGADPVTMRRDADGSLTPRAAVSEADKAGGAEDAT